MPWEKSFDESEALLDAMAVFWKKGYEGTSISDLIDATGINRGSLYNAFGGKRQIFCEALKKYDRENRRAWLAELEALDEPKRALTVFFDELVTEASDDKEKKGCFLINTAVEFDTHDQDTRAVIKAGLKELEGFFRRCIEVGQARQEIPTHLDSQVTAKALMSMVVAIRVLARGVFDTSELNALAQHAKQLLN